RPDLGPDHAALRGRLAARRGDAGGAVGAVRVRRLPAAAPPRTRRDAEVVPPMTMPAFRPTHVVPRHGMPAWEEPDPSRPTADLDPLLPVQLTESRGDWGHVLCSNGWSAWVDGRRLLAVPEDPPAADAPPARTADPRPLLTRVEEALARYRTAADNLAEGGLDGEAFRQRTRGLRVGIVVDGDSAWLYDSAHGRWLYTDGAHLHTYAPDEPPQAVPDAAGTPAAPEAAAPRGATPTPAVPRGVRGRGPRTPGRRGRTRPRGRPAPPAVHANPRGARRGGAAGAHSRAGRRRGRLAARRPGRPGRRTDPARVRPAGRHRPAGTRARRSGPRRRPGTGPRDTGGTGTGTGDGPRGGRTAGGGSRTCGGGRALEGRRASGGGRPGRARRRTRDGPRPHRAPGRPWGGRAG